MPCGSVPDGLATAPSRAPNSGIKIKVCPQVPLLINGPIVGCPGYITEDNRVSYHGIVSYQLIHRRIGPAETRSSVSLLLGVPALGPMSCFPSCSCDPGSGVARICCGWLQALLGAAVHVRFPMGPAKLAVDENAPRFLRFHHCWSFYNLSVLPTTCLTHRTTYRTSTVSTSTPLGSVGQVRPSFHHSLAPRPCRPIKIADSPSLICRLFHQELDDIWGHDRMDMARPD